MWIILYQLAPYLNNLFKKKIKVWLLCKKNPASGCCNRTYDMFSGNIEQKPAVFATLLFRVYKESERCSHIAW